jgi:Tfp pilus assembly protein PilW
MLKNNTGQTLVEVVVGLALAILVLGALINVVITSLYNANYAKSQAEATKIAQQMMEKIRIERDSLGYSKFIEVYGDTVNHSYKCYWYNSQVSPPIFQRFGNNVDECGLINKQDFTNPYSSSTKFKHLITIVTDPSGCGSNCAEVQISIYWADSNCPKNDLFCHKSQINSYLTKW